MAKLPVLTKRKAITPETMAVGNASEHNRRIVETLGKVTVQTVKLSEELNDRLGTFRALHKPKMTNQDTLVAALDEYLTKHGH